MTHTVFCQKLKQELPGLSAPPFPGPRGQFVYENISQQAWQQWLAHQTLLINEKKLNPLEAETRQYLAEQMNRFFAGDQVDQADGYVAPKR